MIGKKKKAEDAPEAKRRTYTLRPERLDDMSPLQRECVQEMLHQHKRLQWLIDTYVMPAEAKPFVAMRLKTMGLHSDEVWMLLVDKLANMPASKFDELYLEMHHYFGRLPDSQPEPEEVEDGATLSSA